MKPVELTLQTRECESTPEELAVNKQEIEQANREALDAADDVNNRINRILKIVKSPSTTKDDQKFRRGYPQNRDRQRQGARRRRGPHLSEDDKDDSAGDAAVPRTSASKTVPQKKTPTAVEPADTATSLNPHAPIFVPGHFGAPGASGAWDEGWEEVSSPQAVQLGRSAFPAVVPGLRESEFIGLQCIAEMGAWVVLRENKPKCKPFFWNRVTGEKSWDAPQIIIEAGIAPLLEKWSVELPDRGVEPGPEAWPEPRWWNTDAQVSEIPEKKREIRSSPPGFGEPPGFDDPPDTSNQPRSAADTWQKTVREGAQARQQTWRPHQEDGLHGSGETAVKSSPAASLVWLPKTVEALSVRDYPPPVSSKARGKGVWQPKATASA